MLPHSTVFTPLRDAIVSSRLLQRIKMQRRSLGEYGYKVNEHIMLQCQSPKQYYLPAPPCVAASLANTPVPLFSSRLSTCFV
mmetsp:Transcript_10649/g.23431  ORF Transcript_10649/g.23431 Transcript_10649/m.23431 type:complete len:82 (+) Transcript_10649:774-1019(+)